MAPRRDANLQRPGPLGKQFPCLRAQGMLTIARLGAAVRSVALAAEHGGTEAQTMTVARIPAAEVAQRRGAETALGAGRSSARGAGGGTPPGSTPLTTTARPQGCRSPAAAVTRRRGARRGVGKMQGRDTAFPHAVRGRRL